MQSSHLIDIYFMFLHCGALILFYLRIFFLDGRYYDVSKSNNIFDLFSISESLNGSQNHLGKLTP